MRIKMYESKNHKSVLFPVAVAAVFAAFIVIPGCGEDGDETTECSGHGHLHDGECHCDNGYTNDPNDANKCVPVQEESFECTTERDGWEQCLDNKVQYCHIVAGMDPHFHWGSDCEALGYECVELNESTAACLDESSTCTAGEFKCENNTAYNCVDHDGHGHWAIDPCGTAKECHEEANEAVCEEHEHTEFDPQTACDAYSGGGGETKAVTTTFGDVFAPDYHADLDVPVTVTLPDNQVSHIHFPVTAGGEYVVFLDVADVLDTILHRDETDQGPLDGGVANSKCPSELVDHYHAELAYDGDCSGPVPFVLRFKAVSTQDVTFVVMKKADLAFPAQACEQFSTCAGETKQVTTTFDDVFAPDYHADLDVPVTVTLPDNAVSYIHFPVTETGEYVVFLGTDNVFTTIKHRDGTDQSPTGGVANGVCPADLPDHWHADLTYDGDGSGPIPFVIEFAAATSQDVTFIVKLHPEE